MTNNFNNISPLDNRYSSKIENVRANFSEFALIKIRFEIEIDWIIYLCTNKPNLFKKISDASIKKLEKFKNNFFESKTSAKRLDYGDCFYAPSLLNDKSNNRIIMSGWVSEASEDYKQKVFGSIALPKVISLKNNKIIYKNNYFY